MKNIINTFENKIRHICNVNSIVFNKIEFATGTKDIYGNELNNTIFAYVEYNKSTNKKFVNKMNMFADKIYKKYNIEIIYLYE